MQLGQIIIDGNHARLLVGLKRAIVMAPQDKITRNLSSNPGATGSVFLGNQVWPEAPCQHILDVQDRGPLLADALVLAWISAQNKPRQVKPCQVPK